MQHTFETNVFGIVRVTQAALPLLRASENPVIVNVAPGLGWPKFLLEHPDAQHVLAVPYPGSKAAVIALTVQYTRNRPEMRINVTDPGFTATDLNGHMGYQTVTEGTDATVAMALVGHDGPTGEFHNRDGLIEY